MFSSKSIQKINCFNNILKNSIKNNEHEFTKRKSNSNKLNLYNFIYSSIQMLQYSADTTITEFLINNKNKINITKSALIKKRNFINPSIINNINSSLIKNIYNSDLFFNKNKYIFLGVDGSQINTMESLINFGIKPSKYKEYGCAKLSLVYDVNNKFPLSLYLSTGYENEREMCLVQVKKLKKLLPNKKFIFIFDRGYYSKQFCKQLLNIGVNCIFRCKNNTKIFSSLEFESTKSINLINRKYNLYKYKINNQQYNILSTLNINYDIKNLYHLRWKTETFFKQIKYNIIKNNTIKSKKLNTLLLDFESIHITSIMNSIVVNILESLNKCKNIKYNETTIIDIFFKKMLLLILKDKKTQQDIHDIMNIFYALLLIIILIID